MKEKTFINLIQKAKRGDGKSFGELYSNYIDQIYRYLFYNLNDKLVAQELAEDVFSSVFKEVPNFFGTEHEFIILLYQTTQKRLINKDLKDDNPNEIDNFSSGVNRIQGLRQTSIKQQLNELISLLSEKQKQVVVLKLIERFNNQEIEIITDYPQESIRILQARGLAKLSQNLALFGLVDRYATT